MAQVVDRLLCKCKALSSNPSLTSKETILNKIGSLYILVHIYIYKTFMKNYKVIENVKSKIIIFISRKITLRFFSSLNLIQCQCNPSRDFHRLTS
jgi:hypothetical protein